MIIMGGSFDLIKSWVKLKPITIDNFIFQIHYKFTVAILVMFSLVITTKQYIGDPIDCVVDSVIPQLVMDTYCWIHSTFTLTNPLTGKVGRDLAHPGIGPHLKEDEVKYHKYYQWVCFTLIFQAIFFYLPHYLWKSWEGKRIFALGMELSNPIVNHNIKKDRFKYLATYFDRNQEIHGPYFRGYFFCEILNFINVLSQIFYTNFFLDGEFLTYGLSLSSYISHSDNNNENPLAKTFPITTKCTFHKYGPSGTIQKFDGLCILPVNILNEKIYLVLWYWFMILAILSGIVILYRLCAICSTCVRVSAICFENNNVKRSAASGIVSKINLGDWFVLNQLKRNVEPYVFAELIDHLDAALLH